MSANTTTSTVERKKGESAFVTHYVYTFIVRAR